MQCHVNIPSQCRAFLKSLDGEIWQSSEIKAPQVKARVAEIYALDEGGRPQALSRSSVTLTEIRELAAITHHMFRVLMLDKHSAETKREAKARVHQFLSAYDSKDIRVITKKKKDKKQKKPSYLKKYNFISLIRAVEQLDDFDTQRIIQEGGLDGEGIVKLLRPLTGNTVTINFSKI